MDDRKRYAPYPSGEGQGTPGWLWVLVGAVAVVVIVLLLVVVWLLLGGQGKPDEAATSEALDARIATQIAEGWASATQAVLTAESVPTETGAPATETRTPADTSLLTVPPTTAVPAVDTATDTPPPTNTATSTATVPPSATPTATRTPTATPTPTPTRACTTAVDPDLAPAWDWARVGCPTAAATIIWSAWEPFEHGYMWWRSDTDWTFVLNWKDGTNTVAGDWATGGESWRWDQVSFPEGHGLTPPSGRFEPIRGFGFVWYNFLGGPGSQMGWATEQEKGFCARIQPFEGGVIFHSSTVQYCQDELFNWATQPSFAPLFFVLSGDRQWRRY